MFLIAELRSDDDAAVDGCRFERGCGRDSADVVSPADRVVGNAFTFTPSSAPLSPPSTLLLYLLNFKYNSSRPNDPNPAREGFMLYLCLSTCRQLYSAPFVTMPFSTPLILQNKSKIKLKLKLKLKQCPKIR